MVSHRKRRVRSRVVQLAALASIVVLAIWLAASCRTEQDADVDTALAAIEDSADRARAALDSAQVDRSEVRAAAKNMVESLYIVERCAKEGHLRSSVYLSDRVGRLDAAASASAGNDAELREKARPILDEIDRLVVAARAEAAKHPRPLRCR